MNGSSFLRKRGEVSHGRRQATRTTPRLLAALIALFLLGLAASSGTSATAADPSLELVKTADAQSVNAGDPVGFRIDLTNHGAIPNQGRIVIETRVNPQWADGSFSFTGELGEFSLAGSNSRTFAMVFPGE
jgi:hypothetical protein